MDRQRERGKEERGEGWTDERRGGRVGRMDRRRGEEMMDRWRGEREERKRGGRDGQMEGGKVGEA